MAGSENNSSIPSTSGDGLSVLDLEHLPKPQYHLMRLVMREGECTHARLVGLIDPALLTQDALDGTLRTLVEQQWLIKTGERYKANLRRKTGRVLSEFQPPRRQTVTLRGIWDSIEAGDEKK